MSLDKVEALESRIGKVVELVTELKDEKELLEGEVERLQAELASKRPLEEELERLRQEKEQMKQRLEAILAGIEGLGV
jgi:FtsZ-binding cell division protein ZapB